MLCCTATLGRPVSKVSVLPGCQAAFLHRVLPLPAIGGASVRRCTHRATAPVTKASEEGVAAVGSDLNWVHVAKDVKKRLAAVTSKKGKIDQLQAWLDETKLRRDTESSEEERSQTEVVAEQEAEYQNLADVHLDVKEWLSNTSSDDEIDSKMAGILTLRLLQAFHAEAGAPFDDEDDDCFWRLQGFLPGALVEALDHDTLQRMIKAYMALPFSGV